MSHSINHLPQRVIVAVALLTGSTAFAQRTAPPRAVDLKDGRLVYQPDAQGNRVPDYSFAGYRAGLIAPPDVPVRVVVAPAEGDDGDRIQAAIHYVASLPLDDEGFRGAVLLLPGEFEVEESIHIADSGIVLRGSGLDRSTIRATGTDRRALVRVEGIDDRTIGDPIDVADDHTPVNAITLKLAAGHGLGAGQRVEIRRTSTQAWIDALGMNNFGGDRHGGQWKPGSRDIVWHRVITSVEGDHITLDAPLTDVLDRTGPGTVRPLAWPGQVNHVGVENLRLISTPGDRPKNEDHAWFGVSIDNAADAWVRQVTAEHFVGGAVAVWSGAQRVSVEDCQYLKPVSELAGLRRLAFHTAGQQTLFQRCFAEESLNAFSTGFVAAGPNAFVQCEASNALGDVGPLDSWATGVLYDNVRVDGNSLSLVNRWYAMQQAGWNAAWSFFWQCSSAVVNVFSPPGTTNWAYGCTGQFTGNGSFASSRESINPPSLYHAQLAERLGISLDEAMERAAFAVVPSDATSSPTVEQAARQTERTRTPQVRLRDWISQAGSRVPLTTAPGDAPTIDALIASGKVVLTTEASREQSGAMTIRNGWLTTDRGVMTGSISGITWWAGGTRPADLVAARDRAPAITRFVPGRSGVGLTDNLPELARSLRDRNAIGIEHHPPLWYSTREADHERVRRMNGDVTPPFYEMPVARSGIGTAWDGLSLYDLKAPNPWYWNRLRTFADLAADEGLVLLNHHYFQHNILEAGAHYASFSWRPVNNINDTGFPEPPYYAGDKRIFIAEQFYDVDHPVRSQLHRSWMRMSVEQLSGKSNVIHLTSGEFTGPTPFVRRWIETLDAWRRETGQSAIIGLATPRDVQDAILADERLVAMVDVIVIDFWRPQADGRVHSPPGGANLAPRQWQRQVRPGSVSADATFEAVLDLRVRHGKPVVCKFDGSDRFGWAILMAGGSLAPLPFRLDDSLVRDVASMTPLGEIEGIRVLADPGTSYLLHADDRQQLACTLPEAPAQMKAAWIDADNGSIIDVGTVSTQNGAIDLLVPPGRAPAILWLRRLEP